MPRPLGVSNGPGIALSGRARHASPLWLAPVGALRTLNSALSSRLWAGPRACPCLRTPMLVVHQQGRHGGLPLLWHADHKRFAAWEHKAGLAVDEQHVRITGLT